jgi:hypothetical protein
LRQLLPSGVDLQHGVRLLGDECCMLGELLFSLLHSRAELIALRHELRKQLVAGLQIIR